MTTGCPAPNQRSRSSSGAPAAGTGGATGAEGAGWSAPTRDVPGLVLHLGLRLLLRLLGGGGRGALRGPQLGAAVPDDPDRLVGVVHQLQQRQVGLADHAAL